MRYNYELKMKAIKAYKNGYYLENPGYCKTNSWKGIIREWVNRYEILGEVSLIHKTKKLRSDEKLSLINEINTGKSIKSVAEAHNISRSVLREWYKKYLQNGINAIQSIGERRKIMPKQKKIKFNKSEKKIKFTNEEIEYILAENAYLKKLQALVQEKNQKTKKK